MAVEGGKGAPSLSLSGFSGPLDLLLVLALRRPNNQSQKRHLQYGCVIVIWQ